MTREERDERVTILEDQEVRSARWRRIGFIALGILFAALIGVVLVQMSLSLGNRERLDHVIEQRDRADTAAGQIAQEKRDQAQSIKALCDSGAITQDAQGKAVCEQASEAAATPAADKVQAIKGDTGSTGAQGAQGPQGIPGADGAEGAQGEPGSTGAPGGVGPPGPVGASGASGAPGVPGAAGAKGDSGNAGQDGAAGKDGSTGAKGDTGQAGAKGDTGAQGPKGDAGAAGPAGPAGPAGADGRGITDAQCNGEGRWVLTWTDGTTSDAGVCRDTTTPSTEPTEDPS